MSRVVASDGVSLSRARSSTSPSSLAPSVTGSAGTRCSRSSLSAVATDVFGVIAGTEVIIQSPALFDRRSTTTGHLVVLEPLGSLGRVPGTRGPEGLRPDAPSLVRTEHTHLLEPH